MRTRGFKLSHTTLFPGPCNSNPCQNGGICNFYLQSAVQNQYYYRCTCPAQFSGVNCEVPSCKFGLFLVLFGSGSWFLQCKWCPTNAEFCLCHDSYASMAWWVLLSPPAELNLVFVCVCHKVQNVIWPPQSQTVDVYFLFWCCLDFISSIHCVNSKNVLPCVVPCVFHSTWLLYIWIQKRQSHLDCFRGHTCTYAHTIVLQHLATATVWMVADVLFTWSAEGPPESARAVLGTWEPDVK